jgi:hypothetical protein
MLSPGTSSHDNSEMQIEDFDFGEGPGGTGRASCVSYTTSAQIICTHGHIQINSTYGGSDTMLRRIICQEIGHIFGLDHEYNYTGCMGMTSYWYSTHDEGHLRAYYG